MNKAFTLIELMIVIAIIAIIAAIAIPNLLESRITANEASAATSLKSGILPAQVQYQAGSYIDIDGDGRGCFASHVASMSGLTGSGTTLSQPPTKTLSLLDPKFNNTLGAVGSCFLNATSSTSRVGGYDFGLLIDTASEDNAESYWGGVGCPKDTTGNEGRRAFGINSTGTIYQSKQTVAQSDTTMVKMLTLSQTYSMFASSPGANVSPQGTGAVPYQK